MHAFLVVLETIFQQVKLDKKILTFAPLEAGREEEKGRTCLAVMSCVVD